MSGVEEIPVDPARLDGKGDIHASYSSDRFPEGKAMRPPFWHQGQRYVCTGSSYGGHQGAYCEAYRLVDPAQFDGEPLPYYEQHQRWAADGDARDYSHGCTGLLTKSGGQEFVLVGPKVRFVPDSALAMPSKQQSLF